MNLAEGTAMVVTDPSNVRWLTGFTGTNGTVYLDHERIVLVTDRRYQDQGPEQIEEAESPADVTIAQDPAKFISTISGARTVIVDANVITWGEKQHLANAIEGEVIASESPFQRIRAQKDTGEIQRIAQAANITDRALEEIIPLLDQQPSEINIAMHLDHKIRMYGASGNAYETIVASGKNSSFPHAQPSGKIIEKGDIVVIDVGAVVDGYRSDMTRTFVIGDHTQEEEKYLKTVLAAQKEAISKLKPGVACKEIDKICRDRIEEEGWGEYFIHGTGHGVGLEIHESPQINSKSEDSLLAGMVITIEPGIYFKDQCGVRWEDLFVITDVGAKRLSRSEKVPQV
jgi:Xaa-Pro aminopeptidase